MALPRAHRVRLTAEFAVVRQQGASWTGRLLVLAALPLPGEPHSRFGFTVTKRSGKAAVRNKLRRRLVAVIHGLRPHITAPHLIITIPRMGAAQASFSTLKAEWARLAHRAGLLPAAP
jgi:ribonuclease P protein component